MTTKNPIECVFLYRAFLCVAFRHGGWEVHCLNYGYTYPGEKGGATVAREKVDYFLDVRYGPKPDYGKQS